MNNWFLTCRQSKQRFVICWLLFLNFENLRLKSGLKIMPVTVMTISLAEAALGQTMARVGSPTIGQPPANKANYCAERGRTVAVKW